jgi:esterase/lipase superfamily enzyme
MTNDRAISKGRGVVTMTKTLRILVAWYTFVVLVAACKTAKAQSLSPSQSFPVTFSGNVVDEDGEPVAGAKVEIRGGPINITVVTDSGGQFRVAEILATPGSYTIRATRFESEPAVRLLTLEPGQVGITLTAKLVVRTRRPAWFAPPPPSSAAGPYLPPPPPPPPRRAQEGAIVKVFYATDRGVSSLNPLDYGPRRGTGLTYGRFDVSVPKDHHLARLERPSILRFEFAEDRAKHFVILERKKEDEEEFYREAAQAVDVSAKKEAFVFIHGFNVTFEEAVYRTAQLAYDLEFPGAAILYSWPSNGALEDYISDQNNNDWTVPHLREFLESVANRTGAKVVHLIAHSMGNRALANALAQITETRRNNGEIPHFRQVILTAPDIDADTFRALARAMKGAADRITLYASSTDEALRVSKALGGGYPRAGDTSTGIVVIPEIDSIDASRIDTGLIGHGYYGDNLSILSDMYGLIGTGSPPSERFRLEAVTVPAGTYWRFRP